jgi:hypothetical protein
MIIILVIFGLLISLTFSYLIAIGSFPVKELVNLGLSLFSAVFLALAYPWNG